MPRQLINLIQDSIEPTTDDDKHFNLNLKQFNCIQNTDHVNCDEQHYEINETIQIRC